MGTGDDAVDPDLGVELSWPSTQPGEPPRRAVAEATTEPPAAEEGGGAARLDAVVAELAALRAEVRALHGMADQLGALRSAVEDLQGQLDRPVADRAPDGMLHDLVAEVTRLRETIDSAPAVVGLGPVVTELGSIRQELVALRRRIRVRASADG
jgi:hypothetical protein